jgi:WD40 repeat protein
VRPSRRSALRRKGAPGHADTLEPIGERIELDAVVQNLFATPDPCTVLAFLSAKSYALVNFVDGDVIEADLDVDPSWVDISPDGTRLAVGTRTGEVGLADIRTGHSVRPPTDDHADWVQRVAYGADGATFVTSGNDGRVKVWDGRTGELLGTIVPGSLKVWAAAEFLPDAHTVIVANRDGAVYEWDTRVEYWIEFACRVVGRDLTDAEWHGVFGDRRYRKTCP